MGKPFQIAGYSLVLASLAWLAARLIAARGPTGLEATILFPAMAVLGVGLVWFGSRRGRLRPGRAALRALLNGYRPAALVYVAARLGLADLLAGGPRSSAELARSLRAHAPSLNRILRGLVAIGICSEERDGRFALTPLGAWLQSDRQGSLRGLAMLCGEERMGAWGGLVHTATTGETAFNHVFGMSQWEHRRQHPELNEYFNEGLTRGTARTTRAVLAAYDFSSFATVADVGGGHGAFLAAILQAHPSITGVLFDQPHVVAGAGPYLEAAGVGERCRVVAGSFFDRIPEGADAHVLKSVIHDWDDEHSLAILRNCHKALKGRGTLLLVERIMPVRVKDNPETIMADVHMLALTGGRERTEAEYRALFARAGFTLTRVIPTRSAFRLIEGVREDNGGAQNFSG